MALLKSARELEHLLPKQNELPFMSLITHTSEKVLLTNTVFAIEVDDKLKRAKSIYRVAFSLFASPTRSYLFIRRANEELSTNTPYISTKKEYGRTPEIEDWDFRVDEIGLHVKIGSINSKTIYFTTSALDLNEIKEKIHKREEKETVILETIYV